MKSFMKSKELSESLKKYIMDELKKVLPANTDKINILRGHYECRRDKTTHQIVDEIFSFEIPDGRKFKARITGPLKYFQEIK